MHVHGMLSLLATIDPERDKYVLLGMITVGIPSFIASVLGVLKIVSHFKLDPPARDYALKAEVDGDLAKLEARINAKIAAELGAIHSIVGETKSTINSLARDFLREVKEINRSIGKVEGELNKDS